MRNAKIVLFLVVGIVLVHATQAATYYVATVGNDTNPGSQAAPLRTIQQAVNRAQAGDTIIVTPGTYYELVTVNKSGTATNRITIKGDRGPNGEHRTILDGGITQLTGWIQAPDVGPGVWKRSSPSWTAPTGHTIWPGSMTANGKAIWKINEAYSNGGELTECCHGIGGKTAFQILALSSTQTFPYGDPSAITNVRFWDGTEALFAIQNGQVYVRFRNGDDPNSKVMRVAPFAAQGGAPAFAPVVIRDQSYLTIADMEIRGAASAVVVRGAANNNIIENSIIKASDANVVIWQTGDDPLNGPQNTIVRNNTIVGDAWGYDAYPPISQETSTGEYARAVATHQYGVNKYIVGRGDSLAIGVYNYYGSGTQVVNNEIYYKTNAIIGFGSMTVANNVIHNINGGGAVGWQGLVAIPATVDVHDNLFYEAGELALRHNDLGDANSANLKVYFYRNRIYRAPSVGSSVYHSFTGGRPETGQDSQAQLYLYHNTFVGGAYFYGVHNPMNEAIPNALFVNNLIQVSNPNVDIVGMFPNYDCSLQAFQIAGWDYNWQFGRMVNCPWVGTHNVNASAKIIEDSSLPVDWSVPAGSSARNAGMDIAMTFTVKGKTYAALPGFSSGYFSGSAPHIGAVQDGGVTPPVTCANGINCNGTSITGSLGQQSCGTSLTLWTCTSSGWQNTGTSCSCGTDTVAPVITNVTAVVTSPTTVTIAWNLNEPATGQVAFGPTTAYGALSTVEPSFLYSWHAQDLANLLPGTTYHYRVQSQDQAGNPATSGDLVFTTPATSLAGDVNNDRSVNMLDLTLVVNDFGKTSGFNPVVDLAAPSGTIDLFDVMVVVRNWGRTA